MVYYGTLSKGCQRCRQRKIKCDQRKPDCMRCEKAKTPCPGFRNLGDVLFRDESARIIQKSRITREEIHVLQPMSSPTLVVQDVVSAYPSASPCPTFVPSTSIAYTFSPPINETGARFFFANFACDRPHLSEHYHDWMSKLYYEDNPNPALRAAIEATGMAGVSNIYYAPNFEFQAKIHYGKALLATKQALSNPAESISDVTLMTVILLGLFEFITIESWDQYRSWTAHIEGATSLLQLRGQEQFANERGGQFLSQLRSQILYVCLQHDIAAPQALLDISHDFERSTMGEHRKKLQPGPLNDICFRILDLRTAIRNGDITSPKAICETAHEIEAELRVWKENVPPSCSYATINAGDTPAGTYFEGKRYLFNHPLAAQVWNNWRTLRIMIQQIILRYTEIHEAAAISLIRQMSTEICISTSCFIGSPHAATLLWPLFVVAQEPLVPRNERIWAVEQLRRFRGVRQANLLADSILQDLNVTRDSTSV